MFVRTNKQAGTCYSLLCKQPSFFGIQLEEQPHLGTYACVIHSSRIIVKLQRVTQKLEIDIKYTLECRFVSFNLHYNYLLEVVMGGCSPVKKYTSLEECQIIVSSY